MSAMLTACAHSAAPAPPIVEQQTVFRVECPTELKLPVPAAITPPAGTVVQANEAGWRYLGDKQAREDLLADRLADAAGQCPK